MFRPLLLLLFCAAPALAQDRTPSHCIALADAAPGVEYLHKAAFGTPLPSEHIRIHYVAHATFVLETQGGLVAATDYMGFLGSTDLVPDVVTMNNAHSSHWTETPEPRIPHVLQGWSDDGAAGEHHLDLGEMLVRNVPTHLRDDGDGVRRDGNSIFVFEVAGLCIGHLGHLHHEPSPEQYATLGRLDVVMVPVDGMHTMNVTTMAKVVRRLRSSVVLPMHWFDGVSLQLFLNDMVGEFDVVRLDQPDVVLSRANLPRRPTIMVLRPAWIR